jgi:hypothetical protein
VPVGVPAISVVPVDKIIQRIYIGPVKAVGISSIGPQILEAEHQSLRPRRKVAEQQEHPLAPDPMVLTVL